LHPAMDGVVNVLRTIENFENYWYHSAASSVTIDSPEKVSSDAQTTITEHLLEMTRVQAALLSDAPAQSWPSPGGKGTTYAIRMLGVNGDLTVSEFKPKVNWWALF
jgi:hypothetical protein